MQVRWKGGEADADQARPGTFSIDPALPDGRYALRITARDPVGNVSRVRWQKIVLDSKPPAVDLSALPSILAAVDHRADRLGRRHHAEHALRRRSTASRSRCAAATDSSSASRRGDRRAGALPLQNLTEGVHDLTLTAPGRGPQPGPGRTPLHGRLDREAAARHHAARSAPAARTSPSSSGGWRARACGRARRRASTTCAPPRPSSLPEEALDAADGHREPGGDRGDEGPHRRHQAPLQSLRVPRRQARLLGSDRDRNAGSRDARRAAST